MKLYFWVGVLIAIVLGISTLVPAPAKSPVS